jgi:PTS system nitrogen regulatory IIA component
VAKVCKCASFACAGTNNTKIISTFSLSIASKSTASSNKKNLGPTKKRVLQSISQEIATFCQTLPENEIFDHLIAREKLGSTGFGNGVAMPHCRLDSCEEVVGAFFLLEDAVDFDAIDNEKVDIIFVLLVPAQANEAHLQTLATLAEKFSQTELLSQLRACTDAGAIFQILNKK